jgi:pyrroloquinoline quinone (PQQ) biosynthesis protein C
MGQKDFVKSVIEDIIEPGVETLLASDLGQGTLSKKRLQGFAVQHYILNISINKGFVLCMTKNAHNQELYDSFLHSFMEEQSHPDLMKKFGFAIGLTDKDFHEGLPIFECQAHAAAILRGMFLGAPAETRTSALVNETMVGRYAQDFDTYLGTKYGMSEDDREFFSVHAVADQEHKALAAAMIERYSESESDRRIVTNAARNMVRFKLAKFDGIYDTYA